MSDRYKYIELVPSTVLPTLRGEDGNNYIEFETYLRIVNEMYEKLNRQGHEAARILNLCDEKDAEIEKYKKAFEEEKDKRNRQIEEYQKKIEELEDHYKFSMMQIDDVLVEFLGVTHEIMDSPSDFEKVLQELIDKSKTISDFLPIEPIKMADWIVHRFKQGLHPGFERDDNGNIKYVELGGEKIPIQTGEYENYTEVREIADYLLSYCKYHSEE